MGQKRKRLALSCVDCRRRKVKCDRTYPICVRCQKSGNADNCTYVSHTGLEPGIPTPSEDSPQQHHTVQPQVAPSGEPYVIAALREMSPHLEVQARRSIPTSNPVWQETTNGVAHAAYDGTPRTYTSTKLTPSSTNAAGVFGDPGDVLRAGRAIWNNAPADASNIMVRGKSFSTHYYGPSFSISMLLQFEELSRFVKGILDHAPSLAGVKEKMAATRAAHKHMKRQSIYNTETNFVDMVPKREIADKLVESYLATFETTYRVLHVPTFRAQYEAYWKNPTSAQTEFVVVLLLMMATMYTTIPVGPKGFCGRGSASREVASRWIEECETWLQEQSHKHIKIAHFQAHVLVFIAKGVNCVKIKREWTATGSLLRFAMAIGMHREPSLLSKRIDIFNQEMRRRLWHTIVELDLLTTIARGMPPTIDSFSWDCSPPRNIDDEDFDESTEQLPASKDRSVYTRTSFLHIATESLPLRVEVLGRVNSVRLRLDLEAVMQYDSKIRDTIDGLPERRAEAAETFACNLSKLLLYDYILVLHIPFASQMQHKSKSFYSAASKRDISFKTLQLYSTMPAQERLIFTNIRDDACRACLALSHDMVTNFQKEVVPDHRQASNLLEIIVETLATRFVTLGQGFHAFWVTLSAYNLLKWKVSSSKSSDIFTKEVADRIADLFQQILDTQVPTPLPNGDLPNAEMFNALTVPSVSESLESVEPGFTAFDQLNFLDPFTDMNFDMPNNWNFEGLTEF